MAQLHLNTGSEANDGTGDPIRTAFIKTEDNFNELFPIFNRKVPFFPYTGSAQILGNLGITGSIETNTISSSILSVKEDPGEVEALNAGITKVPERTYIYFYFSVISASPISFLKEIKVNADDSNGLRHKMSCFDSFLNSQHTRNVNFNGSGNNQEFVFKGTTENFLLSGTGKSGRRVAIKQDVGTTSETLDVNGEISASQYFTTNAFPTSDPNVAGQWFTTSSNEVFGDGNETRILCISQG